METFKRFPLALLASLLTTGIVIYFIAYEPNELKGLNLILAKLATTTMLGVFVFTALRLLEHSIEKRTHLAVLGLGVLGLIVYYFSLPEEMNGFGALLYVFRHIFLILLFFVSILWTPFLKSSLSNVDYWQYAKEVLFSLVMTVLFSIVVIVGVNAALFAVEKLFDFDIRGKYYFMLDVCIVGVFSVSYFLSQIPKKPLLSKATMKPPRVEKFFTQYILTPLTGLYFVILYAYTAKVLVTMDWPKGILAWLIVIFSMVAVLTYLFWTHFATSQTSRWRKWIWLAVLLQTFMLFAAIGMRIVEYSWTENRYMVLMLGVWLAGISVYFLLYKNAKIKWIFISLSVLIAISQVGPLSAYAVSQKAQTQRLQTQLKILRRSEDAKDAPAKVRYEISDVTQYLFNRYGIKSLEPVFPKITAEFQVLDERLKTVGKALREKIKQTNKPMVATKKEDYKKIQTIFKEKPRYLPQFITYELGFKFMSTWDLNNERINFYVTHSNNTGMKARDIKGYDYMSRYNGNSYENANKEFIRPFGNFENIGVTITFEKNILKILKDDTTLTFDMNAYIDKLVKTHGISPQNMTQKDLILEKENDTLKVRIEFQHLNKNNYRQNKSINFNATVLFKLKGEE